MAGRASTYPRSRGEIPFGPYDLRRPAEAASTRVARRIGRRTGLYRNRLRLGNTEPGGAFGTGCMPHMVFRRNAGIAPSGTQNPKLPGRVAGDSTKSASSETIRRNVLECGGRQTANSPPAHFKRPRRNLHRPQRGDVHDHPSGRQRPECLHNRLTRPHRIPRARAAAHCPAVPSTESPPDRNCNGHIRGPADRGADGFRFGRGRRNGADLRVPAA